MGLLNDILEGLGAVGTVLDTPRAMAWQVPDWLSGGDSPLDVAVNPEKRKTGWDVLKGLGIEGQEGFDWTDIPAMALEAAGDPLNALGAWKLLNPLTKASSAKSLAKSVGGTVPRKLKHLSAALEKSVPGGIDVYKTSTKGKKAFLGGMVSPDMPESITLSSSPEIIKEGEFFKGIQGHPILSTYPHEVVHSMYRTKNTNQRLGRLLEDALGKETVHAGAEEYWGPMAWQRWLDPGRYREEGVATLLGNATYGHPEIIRSMARNEHDAVQQGIAKSLMGFYDPEWSPRMGMTQAKADSASQIFSDFLRGNYALPEPYVPFRKLPYAMGIHNVLRPLREE